MADMTFPGVDGSFVFGPVCGVLAARGPAGMKAPALGADLL